MSPEVALLVRAALLGLALFTLERVAKRRQERRSAARRTIIRLPVSGVQAPEPLTGRPVQVAVRPRTQTPVSATPEIVRLESTPTATPTATPKLYDGHVTEKRAA